MIIRNKYFELYLPSDYKHWCFHFGIPSDDVELWPTDAYRARLTIGFYKLFLIIYLWKVIPFKGSFNLSAYKQYGFTFFDRTIHLHWGETKVINLPWQWTHVRHCLLLPNGDLYWRNTNAGSGLGKKEKEYTWYDIFEGKNSPYKDNGTQTEVAQFVEITHITKDGRRQDAKIRLTGEEREWRWKWFKWLPRPCKIQRTVYCSSDIELGERAGSWKGGMMGWSCEWRKDETLKGAFYRWYSDWNGR